MTPEMFVAAGITAVVLLLVLFVVGVVIGGAPDDRLEMQAVRDFDVRHARLAELARLYHARQRERTEIDWTR